MARSKAKIETFPQLKEIVQNLKAKYGVALEDVDPDRILYLKSGSTHSKKVIKISSISVPHPSVTPLKFDITVFPKFDRVDQPRQTIYVLRELLRIKSFEDGKLGNYELQDFPVIVEKYGTTWEDREDLQNPLEE